MHVAVEQVAHYSNEEGHAAIRKRGWMSSVQLPAAAMPHLWQVWVTGQLHAPSPPAQGRSARVPASDLAHPRVPGLFSTSSAILQIQSGVTCTTPIQRGRTFNEVQQAKTASAQTIAQTPAPSFH